jgi:hypothetical protein
MKRKEITQMNNTTNNKKVSLEDITETYKGTTEYSAYGNLGKARREITGILGVNRKANAFKLASIIAKPFSIIGSAFGFATITTGIANQDIFSILWFILFGFGLFIGAFFEYLSTANEDSLVGHRITKMTTTGIILIVFIKSYAVFMHYQTANQIQSFLLNNKEIDTPKAKLLKEEIETIREDIKATKAQITKELIANTTSVYTVKRGDAIALKEKIENKISILQERLRQKQKELIEQGESDKQSKIDENKGLIWTFFTLLVIFELSGTLMSVLYKKTVITGVDETIATAEEVKARLYSKRAGLEETTNRLNAFRVADEIKANHNAITLMELETAVREDELLLRERANNSKIKAGNKELELLEKMQELEELKYQKMINAIEAKIERINAIDTPIIKRANSDTDEKKPIGFRFDDDVAPVQIVNAILDSVEKAGDKTPPKSSLIDTRSRRQKEAYETAMRSMMKMNVVDYYAGKGYYMAVDKETAHNLLFK